MRLRLPFAAALVAVTQLGATDCGEILEDPGFDHWCGDMLCFWELERGAVARVGTWHGNDDGVELVGPDVAISQVTRVSSIDTDCIDFEMVADVAEDAEVHLEADVFGDGTVEWRERIPTSDWRRVSLRIGISGWYEGVKFRLTKVGPGRAVLAQIAARVSEGACPSYLDAGQRPEGVECVADGDCASGICNDWVCSSCRGRAESCDDGMVCGRTEVPPPRHDYWACVPVGARAVGEGCFLDDECASAVCNEGVCGECGMFATCETGSCEAVADSALMACSPGSGDRPSGAGCTGDADCASGACDGTPFGFCEYSGERCEQPGDCASTDEVTQPCTLVAIAGGTCQ